MNQNGWLTKIQLILLQRGQRFLPLGLTHQVLTWKLQQVNTTLHHQLCFAHKAENDKKEREMKLGETSFYNLSQNYDVEKKGRGFWKIGKYSGERGSGEGSIQQLIGGIDKPPFHQFICE